MADFDFIAIDTRGNETRGHVAADTVDAARAQLDRKRLYVVKIEPGTPPTARGKPLFGLTLGTAKMSGKHLTLFTRQLATLNRVSPLEESLRTITRQTEQDNVRAIVERVHAGVVEGRRLADAMAREPKSFPPLYRAMVAAGESSGSLPEILERLSLLLERQAEIRGKILTALAYPTILAIVALGVVTALMVFVVPQVVEQFDTVGQELPFLTRMVIGLSAFLVNYWWVLLAMIGLAGVIAWQALKQPPIRLAFDSWTLRVPLIGRLIRDLHAARMARTLGTMVASRLPLMERPEPDRWDDPQSPAEGGVRRDHRGDPGRGQPVGGDAACGRLSAAADVSGGIGRSGGTAGRNAGARGGLSGARVRSLHRDRAVAAGAAHHRHHGRYRRDDRAIDPAADPSAQHAGGTVGK